MRSMVFASRTAKEILRDPVNLGFGVGFPVIVLMLLSAIQKNIPNTLFPLQALTPGIAVFGMSFLTLFSATLIARDRGSALLERLFATPMTAAEFLLGYLLPIFPMALAQTAVCYLTALALGLAWSWQIPAAILAALASAFVFVPLGLLCGSVLNDRQVGGICGALLTNLTAWLSDTWFSVALVGGAFESAAKLLPFVHGVELGRLALSGDYDAMLPHLLWVLGYGAVLSCAAIVVFQKKMKR